MHLVGTAAAVVQLAGLLEWSRHLWSSYALTTDFALYDQAWQRIAGGHLDPYSTIYPYFYPHYGYPFVRNHFELAMWPLALLHLISSSSFTLLVVQDVALAGTVLVTYLWCTDVLRRYWPLPSWPQLLLALVVLAALVTNPFVYETASFDVHLQAPATLFLVLAGRDLWKGHHRRGVLLAAIALTFGAPIALYVVGLGLAAAVSRAHRPAGVAVIGIGLAWLGLAGSLHVDIGSHVGGSYGYLIGRPGAHDLSVLTLGAGLAKHPAAAVHVLATRWHAIYQFVASGGGFGVFSPWGLALAVTVLVPNALNVNPAFISDPIAFQSFAAVPFVLVGSLLFGLWLVRTRLGRPAGVLVLIVACVQIAVVAGSILPGIESQWPVMNAKEAATLSAASSHIPSSAEVIASVGVIGRFAGRRYVYPQVYPEQQFPVHGRTVYFVFYDDPSRANDVREVLRAQPVDRAGSVAVFEWHPPKGTRTVDLSPRG